MVMTTPEEFVDDLVYKANDSYNEQMIEVDGEEIPLLMLQDTTKLSLEGLAKVYVQIDCEIMKLQIRQERFERMEIRRLFAFQKVIRRLMEDIILYRGRMLEKYPDLLEQASL